MNTCEDRYRLMVEHTSDVVFTAGLDGCVDWVSPSVVKLTGDPPEQLIGENLMHFVAEDHVDRAVQLLAAILRGEEVAFEGRVARGRVPNMWVSAHAAPLRDDDGTLIGIIGTVRDITDVVAARTGLQAALEDYRLLAEYMGDVVFRLSPDLTITWVSPSVHRVLGYDMADLVGSPLARIVPEADLAAMTDEQRSLDDAAKDAEHPVVAQVRRADGSLRWVANRPTPVRDEAGNLIGIVTTWSDVEELVQARELARRRRDRLRATLDTLIEPHVLMEAVLAQDGSIIDFVYVEANQAACAFNRTEPIELVGKLLSEAAPHYVFVELCPMLAEVARTGIPMSFDEYRFTLPDGTLDDRFVDMRATRIGNAVSHAYRDSTDRHAYEARLSHMASHDALTGLANRRTLTDELGRALSSATRSGRSVAAVMLDLDHFKSVNDVFGHAAGDELLIATSRRIERSVRSEDLAARLGGDEFVVAMRDLADSSEAVRVANRILEAFREPITVAGNELEVSASVGIAISTPDSSVDDLLHAADEALYRAKAEGRDRYALYNEDLRMAASERVELEAQLRPALDLGELAVHYQPEIDLATGAVCAVEALLRWHHPSGELLSAAKFIEVAEEIGVIIESGNWVVSEACAQAARWAEHGLTMRVNLSRQQLNEAGLVAAFERALAASGVPASAVCAEVSEGALTVPSGNVQRNLRALREIGVRLAIDNFGTGHAALSYLRDLDMVKIHRSYVHALEHDEYSRRLVAGIVALADRLGLQVAAEGVETTEQVRLLRELGCSAAQGYVFQRALPADAIEPLLRQRFDVA